MSQKWSHNAFKDDTGYMFTPSMTAASSAFSVGTNISVKPLLYAEITIGSIPFIGCTVPSSESSPKNAHLLKSGA